MFDGMDHFILGKWLSDYKSLTTGWSDDLDQVCARSQTLTSGVLCYSESQNACFQSAAFLQLFSQQGQKTRLALKVKIRLVFVFREPPSTAHNLRPFSTLIPDQPVF